MDDIVFVACEIGTLKRVRFAIQNCLDADHGRAQFLPRALRMDQAAIMCPIELEPSNTTISPQLMAALAKSCSAYFIR